MVYDVIRIMETRPLSKDKRWRLVEIVEKRNNLLLGRRYSNDPD